MNNKTISNISRRRKGGFTFIELTVTVGIIAILAVVFAAGYNRITSYVGEVSSTVMVEKLNNAASAWLTLQMQAGNPNTAATDLGADIADAVTSLQTPVTIGGRSVDVGLARSITADKLTGMGITFDAADGLFKLANSSATQS